MHLANNALIVIDVQNDFCPGGALAVNGGNEIIEGINALMLDFPVTILTQDWHPEDHSSFASQHKNMAPFQVTEMIYGPQVLWPTHCVWGTTGAAFHHRLATDPADMIIRKGFRHDIDSYSAFFENDHKTPTGLHGYLQERGIDAVTLVGLATDYCVNFTALDAARLDYDVTVLTEYCRAIDLDGSLKQAIKDMKALGVKVV